MGSSPLGNPKSQKKESGHLVRVDWRSKNETDSGYLQVTYFKKRRVMEYQRNQTLERLKAEGAQEMPGQLGPGGQQRS